MHRLRSIGLAAALAPTLGAGAARAETPADLLASFEQAARAGGGFTRFSGERGRKFFESTHGTDWSCASCHTQNPAAAGRHAKTGKAIAPLAPAANAERFTSAAKVAKWFKRNCDDVLGRECTPREKGDVFAYLLSVRP